MYACFVEVPWILQYVKPHLFLIIERKNVRFFRKDLRIHAPSHRDYIDRFLIMWQLQNKYMYTFIQNTFLWSLFLYLEMENKAHFVHVCISNMWFKFILDLCIPGKISHEPHGIRLLGVYKWLENCSTFRNPSSFMDVDGQFISTSEFYYVDG